MRAVGRRGGRLAPPVAVRAPHAARSAAQWGVVRRRRPVVLSPAGCGAAGWRSGGWPGGAQRCRCAASLSRSFSATPSPSDTRDGSAEKQTPPAATTAQHIVSPINIPNALTLSRILATPVFIHWINIGCYDLVLGGFFAAAITDFFDGYLARKWQQITAIGSFLDPLADKVLVNGLAVPLAMQGMLPGSLVALICGRDLAIIAVSKRSFPPTFKGKHDQFTKTGSGRTQ
jgi:hypothetical protein